MIESFDDRIIDDRNIGLSYLNLAARNQSANYINQPARSGGMDIEYEIYTRHRSRAVRTAFVIKTDGARQ